MLFAFNIEMSFNLVVIFIFVASALYIGNMVSRNAVSILKSRLVLVCDYCLCRSRPSSYLGLLLGHEGKGSLLSALKRKYVIMTYSILRLFG